MSLPELVFFKVETTFPKKDGRVDILEFGAIVVCPKTLIELKSYSALVRPTDASVITQLPNCSNGINQDTLKDAETFTDIADKVYKILHGRVWVGHNIRVFDCPRLLKAFADIDRQPPKAKDIIDTLQLLTQLFGNRAKNMEMATLASYFGLGQQAHRSLDDIQMNLKVLQSCATILLLEEGYPYIFTSSLISPDATAIEEKPGLKFADDFVELEKISTSSITVCLFPLDRGIPIIHILHEGVRLQVCCTRLKVRIGISSKFVDYAGQQRLHFVVDASPSLCEVLDVCDNLAGKLSMDSGSNSKWRPIVTKMAGFKIVQLYIPTTADGTVPRDVVIYKKQPTTSRQKFVLAEVNVKKLDSLFVPGTLVDACFSLDSYDCELNTGFRLVAKKLIVHCS